MTKPALPCIVCRTFLSNITDDGGNQPSGGTEFVTYGHYGSSVFDPMDGSLLVLNICDPCLRRGLDCTTTRSAQGERAGQPDMQEKD